MVFVKFLKFEFRSCKILLVALSIQRKTSLISTCTVLSRMFVFISRYGLFIYFNGPFHCDQPQMKFNLLLLAMKSNVNRIVFSRWKHTLRFIFINFFVFLKMKNSLIEILLSLFISSLKLCLYYNKTWYLAGKNSDNS